MIESNGKELKEDLEVFLCLKFRIIIYRNRITYKYKLLCTNITYYNHTFTQIHINIERGGRQRYVYNMYT